MEKSSLVKFLERLTFEQNTNDLTVKVTPEEDDELLEYIKEEGCILVREHEPEKEVKTLHGKKISNGQISFIIYVVNPALYG